VLGCWLFFVLSVKGDEKIFARDDYHVVRSVRRKTRMFCLS